jgi:hypothetical protein
METNWLAILLCRVWSPRRVIHNSAILNTRSTIRLLDIPIEGPIFDLVEVTACVNAVNLGLHELRAVKPEVVQSTDIRAAGERLSKRLDTVVWNW